MRIKSGLLARRSLILLTGRNVVNLGRHRTLLLIYGLKAGNNHRIHRNNGGQAVTSYTLIPDLASIDDKTKMTTIVEQIGVDSVVITSLQSIDQKQRTVPAQVDYIPTMGRGYYGYYRSSYHAVYQPAYTTTDTIVRLETRVYAVATKAMIWAGTTESLNPGSADSIIKETADVIRKDMQEHGLIQ